MKVKKIMWGIFFILISAIILINKLGIIEIGNLWNLIISLLLIPIIIKSIKNLHFMGILIPIAIICILYSNEIGISNISPWYLLLAASFAGIGLSLIFGNHYHFCKHYNKSTNKNSGDDINIDTNFNSSIEYIDSKNFKGGVIDCSFGSVKVYFNNCELGNEDVILKLDISFSGVELYIPKEWKIKNKVNVFAGSVDEKITPIANTKSTLILTGEVNFSGVTIIYI